MVITRIKCFLVSGYHNCVIAYIVPIVYLNVLQMLADARYSSSLVIV